MRTSRVGERVDETPPPAVCRPQADGARHAHAATALENGNLPARVFDVVRVDERPWVDGRPVRRAISEQPFMRWARVGHPEVVIEDRDEIGAALDDGSE